MAKTLTYMALPGIEVENTYWMVGSVKLNAFDRTAEIEVRCYLNEDARHQRVDEARGALKVINVFVHLPQYEEFFAPEILKVQDNDPIRAAYTLLTSYDEPLGLRNLLAGGEDA